MDTTYRASVRWRGSSNIGSGRQLGAGQVLVVVGVFQATSAHASIIMASGTWTSGPVSGQGYSNQVFTGSASYSYDTSVLTMTGTEVISGSLTSFSQSPSTIGITTMDLTNTGFVVQFVDGDMVRAMIGPTPDVTGMAGNSDDFWIMDYADASPFQDNFAVSVATESSICGPGPLTVSFTHVPVPEPTTLFLLGLTVSGGIGRRLRNIA